MVLAYFSTPQCNVCKVLRPKVESALAEHYPAVRFIYVDTTAIPEVAGQLSIFAVPTIVLFVEGRESVRKSRNFAMDELLAAIDRPYGFLFGDEST